MKPHFLIAAFLLVGLLPTAGDADTFSTRIIDFRDDAEEDITGPTAGDVRRASSDLEIGNENLVEQWVGVRFQDVTIPAGSVINSATIQFTGTTTDVGILSVPILGELSPDPLEFGDLTPLTTRTLTMSSVAWTIDPWVLPNDVFGANTTTPDLAVVVQDIVDQNGWDSGNSMAFIFQNDPMDTSERIAVSYDGDPAQAALLTIDFTPPESMVCDFNGDAQVDDADIDFYSGNLGQLATFDPRLDLNNDGVINLADHDLHIATCVETLNGQVGTFVGDINLDGTVNVLGDAFVLVASLGQAGVSGYANGDLNADQAVDVLGDAFRLVANLGLSN